MLTIKEARLAVRLSSGDFDSELQDMMDAAVLDLNVAGIAEKNDDRLYDQALRMYLKGYWEPGAPEAADCRKIYEDIKGTMKHSSKYREVVADA